MTDDRYFTIKFRRNSPARWASLNPVLAEGEPGYEKYTGKMKVGDGKTSWMDLEYVNSANTPFNLDEHINDELPHPVYDDGPSLALLYQNAKV